MNLHHSFILLSMVTQATCLDSTKADINPGKPFLVPLHRETVPVLKDGKVISYKAAYSGAISVGGPKPQEFSVVFDTGSGHVILPSVGCKSDTCLAHRRYNMSKSSKAVALNADSEPVPANEEGDEVQIGFGTGSVTGGFVRESICLGQTASKANKKSQEIEVPCSLMSVVVAVEMSAQPFESFKFDGIFGLGLDSLALSNQFSFFSRVWAQNSGGFQTSPHFAMYLGDNEKGENSEIAVGGYNSERLSGSLSWAPVAAPKLGFWNIKIRSVRIGNTSVLNCKKGNCKAIVDTGTSHLGVPQNSYDALQDMLSQVASADTQDCRVVKAPALTIELHDFTLTLGPEDYMRPLPLPEPIEHVTSGSLSTHSCQPKVMPVNMKKPLGPNLFILGEPVLHRYYTVFDWKEKRVGFGLASRHGKQETQALPTSRNTSLDESMLDQIEAMDTTDSEVENSIYLMQVSLTIVGSLAMQGTP